MALFGGHILLAWRTYRWGRRRDISAADARLYAASCAFGKFPQAVGQLRYWKGRILGRTEPHHRIRKSVDAPSVSGASLDRVH